MTSCLGGGGGGGRTYRLDLDMVKSSSSSTRSSSSSSSSPSSALSDSSHLPLLAISIKKPRAPRKRPNQTYNEAAALLSTAYPTVFLPSPKTLSKQPRPLCPSSSSSSSSFPPDPSADLLPALPVLGDAAFLIPRPSPVEPKAAVANNEFAEQPSLSSPTSAVTAEFRDGSCSSPALSPAVSNEFREELPPGSPAFSDGGDFDAESILDEEAEQGIDAIMGNLSMSAPSAHGNENENGNTVPGCGVNPYVRSLVGFGLGGKFELGLGFTYGRSIHRALRQRDGGHRWSSPTVPVKDICSKFKAPTASSPSVVPAEAKKSKKKSKKVEKDAPADTHSPASAAAPPAATAAAEQAEAGSKRVALGLKLNHDEVLKAWSDRGSMFSSDGPDSPNSSAEALAKLADIDLVPESGAREASVMRYKEKRRSRLFAKKIRYQVRKANADCRPRMKGRFVRRPSLLQQAIEDGS